MSQSSDKYPETILYKNPYVDFLDLRSFPQSSDLIVIRRNEAKVPDFELALANPIEDPVAVLGITVLGLSVNMLGGLFLDSYIRYNPKNPKESVKWHDDCTPVKDTDYTVFHKCKPLYFRVSEINGNFFHYKIGDQDKGKVEENRKISKLHAQKHGLELEDEILAKFYPKEKTAEYVSRVEVNHHPTDMNFWHFQLDAFPLIEDKNAEELKHHRKINSRFRNFLYEMKKDSLPLTYSLPESLYFKK